MDLVRDELTHDITIDITTTGRTSGAPRRIEIWMVDVDGHFYITGTPGRRDWLANLRADPALTIHLKQRTLADLPARAREVLDPDERRHVLEHAATRWYRAQTALDDLVDSAPMVEIHFTSREGSDPTRDA